MVKFFRPSRWCGGVSLLWNGAELKSIFGINNPTYLKDSNIFFFDSARNALFHYLRFKKASKYKSAYICDFTCDAVSDVFTDSDISLNFYFLKSNFCNKNLSLNIQDNIILNQNTFGINAINEKNLALLAKKNLIINDYSIGYGVNTINDSNIVKYATLISFEVSKSITIGWAGAIMIPKSELADFMKYYSDLKSVHPLVDFRRILISILNVLGVRFGSYIYFPLWVVSKIVFLQRRSSRSSILSNRIKSKLGWYSSAWLLKSLKSYKIKLMRSNYHHDKLAFELNSKGYEVVSQVDQNYSSPRVCFKHSGQRKYLFEHFSERRIECGEWFQEPPIGINKNISEDQFKDSIIGNYLNLPCHYGLSSKKLQSLLKAIRDLKTCSSIE